MKPFDAITMHASRELLTSTREAAFKRTVAAPADSFCPPPVETDEATLLAAARRDPAHFGEIYRRHHEALAGYILRRVGDRHIAEDLTAEVFLAALRSLHRFRWTGAPLRVWLLQIATNQINNWARRRARTAMPQIAAPDETPAAALNAEGWPAPSDAREALLALSPRLQSALALHYLEGMDVRTVATVLRRSEGTVKSRLARGRDALRCELERRRPR